MSTVKVSGDGKDFFEIPDSDVGEAMDKGYQVYYDVSGDGKEFHTIPGDDLQEAVGKGYKLKSVWDSESGQMSGVGRAAVDTTLTGVEKVGQAMDYLTGAPTRAGLYEMVKPGDEGVFRRGLNSAKAFASQYLKSPSTAPTEKDIGASLGLSTDESIKLPIPTYTSKGGLRLEDMAASPAGLLGGALSMASDPTNLIGLGAAPRVGMAATKSGVKTVAKGVSEVAKAAESIPSMRSVLKALPEGTVSKLSQADKTVAGLVDTPLLRSKVAPDFPELAAIAREADIPVDKLPAAVEFGPKSVVTMLEKANMDSPLGEAMRESHAAIVGKTRDAVEGLTENIGGGLKFDTQEAGQVIRDGYRKRIASEMADQENSYAKVAGRMGDAPITDAGQKEIRSVVNKWREKVYAENLENVRDPATGLVIQQPSAKGRAILDNVDGAAQAQNLNEIHKQIKIVGKQAFDNPLTFGAPIDQRAMRELYGDLRQAFTDTVESVDPKQAASLKEHNARMTKVLGNREMFEKIIENVDKDPEQVFKFVTGNTNRVDALREVLTPGEFQAVKSAVVGQMLKPTASGDWTFGRLAQEINRNRKTLNAMLTPEELSRLENLQKLGNRMGADTLNPSGTAKELQYIELAKSPIKSILANQTMQRIGKGLADAGRSEAVAKGMSVEGSRLPVGLPSGFVSTLDQSVSKGPLNPLSQFQSMSTGERLMDAAGKARLYSKHQYQQKQEQINEQERDQSGADKIKTIIETNPSALGKYGPALDAAMKRGGNAYAVTHFLLQQREPEYRQLMKDLENN